MSESIAHHVREGHAFQLPANIEECQKLLRETRRAIKKMEKEAVSRRDDEQQTLLSAAKIRGDTKTAKAIKYKMIAETTKRMFQKLSNCRGRQNTGLSTIDVPRDPTELNHKDCTDWIMIDTPTEIEALLISRNQQHFGQAKGSFPTNPPLF